METLKQDLQKELQVEGGHEMYPLDVLGYDRKLRVGERVSQLTMVIDKNHCSSASIQVTPLQNITFRLIEQGAMEWIYNTRICGNLGITCGQAFNNGKYPDVYMTDVLSIFKPIALKIGQMQIGYSNAEYYNRLKLFLLNKSFLRPYADDLIMDIEDYNEWFNGQAAQNLTPAVGQIPESGYSLRTDSASLTPSTGKIMLNGYAGIVKQAKKKFQQRVFMQNGQFSIPIWMLFPALLAWKDKVGYLGAGQTIEMTVQTLGANIVLLPGETLWVQPNANAQFPGQFSYVIDNIQMMLQYTELDQPLIDELMRTEFSYAPLIPYSYPYPIPGIPAQITAQFAVSRGQRLHKLIFGFFYQNPQAGYSKSVDAIGTDQVAPYKISTLSRAYGNTDSTEYNPLSNISYSVPMLISQINIQYGSYYKILNAQTLSIIQQLSHTQDADGEWGKVLEAQLFGGARGAIHSAYAIDLDMYPLGDEGVGSPGQSSVIVQFFLQSELGSQTLSNATTATVANKNFIQTVGNGQDGMAGATFQLQAFIEYSTEVHMKDCMYVQGVSQ